MQIKTVETRQGAKFEFVRWEYDPERKRGKSTSLGRMPVSWDNVPAAILERATEAEQADIMQFMAKKREAERLHTLKRAPQRAVAHLAACVEYFKLDREHISAEDAAALCSAIDAVYAAAKVAGYAVAPAAAKSGRKPAKPKAAPKPGKA